MHSRLAWLGHAYEREKGTRRHKINGAKHRDEGESQVGGVGYTRIHRISRQL